MVDLRSASARVRPSHAPTPAAAAGGRRGKRATWKAQNQDEDEGECALEAARHEYSPFEPVFSTLLRSKKIPPDGVLRESRFDAALRRMADALPAERDPAESGSRAQAPAPIPSPPQCAPA